VSETFHAFALEQLARILPVTGRKMFGGVGIYADGFFFALMDDDTLYLKVDESNRADFEARGLGPFQPFGEGGETMQYYPVPEDVLEAPDALRLWADKALAVARQARARKQRPTSRRKKQK
jgi:DNA transformation protein